MYKKNNNSSSGFTLTELLVGLSIGIVVLTGLMSFYFRSTKMISQQQTIAKNLTQLQFVMNKIVQDIREANTEAPGTGSTITGTSWSALPYMGYGRTYPNVTNELDLYQPSLAYPKEFPTYPVAYNFPVYQSGKTGTNEGWYPRQDPSTEKNDLYRECNQLVFYKVKKNPSTSASYIERIIYYADPDPKFPNDPKLYVLKKRTQTPTSSIGKKLKEGTDFEEVILSDVKFVQFTYPILTKKLALEPPTYDPDYDVNLIDLPLKTQLNNINTMEPDAAKRPFSQSVLLNPYRNIIQIRIATAGPQIGNKRATAFELSTEVTVRN